MADETRVETRARPTAEIYERMLRGLRRFLVWELPDRTRTTDGEWEVAQDDDGLWVFSRRPDWTNEFPVYESLLTRMQTPSDPDERVRLLRLRAEWVCQTEFFFLPSGT